MHKPRKPWLAGVFTFLSIGMGHLYAGQLKRGIALFLIGQLLFSFALISGLFSIFCCFFIFFFLVLGFLVFCIVDAVKYGKAGKTDFEMKPYNKWYFYLLFFILATTSAQLGIEVFLKTYVVEAFKIPAGSMRPTLSIGDHLFANKAIYRYSEPERGDIIIFEYPEDPSKMFVKRVVAMAGETIEINDKVVLIDGNVFNESYVMHADSRILPKELTQRDNMAPLEVPPDCYFVMGDNRDNSHDSRFWGGVHRDEIKGKAIQVYWSWDKADHSVRWRRIGKRFENIGK